MYRWHETEEWHLEMSLPAPELIQSLWRKGKARVIPSGWKAEQKSINSWGRANHECHDMSALHHPKYSISTI